MVLIYEKMYFPRLAEEVDACAPDPWDVARELEYWSDHQDKIDVPLPKDLILYRKHDRLSKSNQHCLEANRRGARGHLRAYSYIAHVRLSKF